MVTILATIPVHVPPGGGKDQSLSEAFWKEARASTAPNRYSSGHLICIRSWMTLTYIYTDSSVQFSCSVVSDSLQPHEPQHSRPPCPSPTPGVYSDSCLLSRWCHPTISSSIIPFLLLPSIFPNIRVFWNESALRIRWPKYWSFSFSISPSNEYSGLMSFRMDWLDLLAVQGTLKSLLQHHS